MPFTSVEQRIAHTYQDTLPPFVPAQDGPSAAEQAVFYRLIQALHQLAFDEPELFVPQLYAPGDDAFPNRFNRTAYGKPELLKAMKKMQKAVDDMLAVMFEMGAGRPVKLSKRQAVLLARLGIAPEGPLLPAWVWMSTRPDAGLLTFSRCMFDADYPYLSDVYARLLGNEAAFRRLEAWMLAHGYERFLITNTTASDDRASLTYANPAWGPTPPKGGFEYGMRHTGVSMRYDIYIANPQVLGVCIPGGMKVFLEKFGEMDSGLQSFVAERNKQCDACGYCVQTDKTGKRPKAFVSIGHEGKKYAMCTYFQGARFCFTSLTDALVDRIIGFLAFMDGQRG